MVVDKYRLLGSHIGWYFKLSFYFYTKNIFIKFWVCSFKINVDHIYPANRGGLAVPESRVLIFSPCNLSKSANGLRGVTKRNHLNHDKNHY